MKSHMKNYSKIYQIITIFRKSIKLLLNYKKIYEINTKSLENLSNCYKIEPLFIKFYGRNHPL